MGEPASIAAENSGMIDFEAKVGFRLGMSAPALTDHLVQAGFSRKEAEAAAERAYARRASGADRYGMRLLLVGAVVFPVVVGLFVLVLMSGWFVKILAIAHLVGLAMIVAGVKHVSAVRAAGGKR